MRKRAPALLAMVALVLAACSGSLVTASDIAALSSPTGSPPFIAPTATPSPVLATPSPSRSPSPSPSPAATPSPAPGAESPASVLAMIEARDTPAVSLKELLAAVRAVYKRHPDLADGSGPVGLRERAAEGQATDCLRRKAAIGRSASCRLFLSIWLFGPYSVSYGGAAFRGSAYEASGYDPDALAVGVWLARDWVADAGSGAARHVRRSLGLLAP